MAWSEQSPDKESEEQRASDPLIFLSAGEASGEHYGAGLITALHRLSPRARVFGLGGRRMTSLGFDAVVRAEDVAHMGITEVIRHAPFIYREYRKLKQSIEERRPDLAILIDFPDVNLRLAEALSRFGVPVVYFVSPQLWAWKKRRLLKVRRYVTRMLVIFPFEESFYQKRGIAAEFVGHPLAEKPPVGLSRAEYAHTHQLDPNKIWIALLPGSRKGEVALNLPEMARAAELLGGVRYEFLLPVAPTLDAAAVLSLLQRLPFGRPEDRASIHLVHDAPAALQQSYASIVASGTATVEAALAGRPFVVVYRLSALSYAIASRVVTVPHVAMANLIAGRRIVPELIQRDFTAARIVQELMPFLSQTPERARAVEELKDVRRGLQRDDLAGSEQTLDRVARISLGLISCPASNNTTVPAR